MILSVFFTICLLVLLFYVWEHVGNREYKKLPSDIAIIIIVAMLVLCLPVHRSYQKITDYTVDRRENHVTVKANGVETEFRQMASAAEINRIKCVYTLQERNLFGIGQPIFRPLIILPSDVKNNKDQWTAIVWGLNSETQNHAK